MSAQELLGRLRSRWAPADIYARPRARGHARRRRRTGVLASKRARGAGGRRRAGLLASRRARWLAVSVVALVAVLGGGWLWLRDSSLVAVERVTITGVSGPDAGQIRGALAAAARTMSTLDVHVDRLRTAIAPYPVVRDVQVSAQFPHGLRIHVVEQLPVATVQIAGQLVPVAGDGTLLHDAQNTQSLPVLQLGAPPGGPRLTEPDALSAVALLAAAPYALLAKISQVSRTAAHGFAVQLRDGPVIYFGDASQLTAKWQAAIAVLSDPGSRGAVYIDVSDPQRPAAGAGGGAAAATGSLQGTSAAGGTAAGTTGAGTTAAGATGTGATAAGATGTGATAAGTTATGATAAGTIGAGATGAGTTGAGATGTGATATGATAAGATATGATAGPTASGAAASGPTTSAGSTAAGA